MKAGGSNMQKASGSSCPSARDERSQARDNARQVFLRDLPDLMDQAINRYRELLNLETPSTSKGIASHQIACRAALGHIEQLLRVGRTQSDMEITSDQDVAIDLDLHELLKEARAALDMTVERA
jgi:hypothetical protein